MAEIVRDGVAAGALGFSSSRTLLHRAIDGECVPGTFAAEDELLGIGRVLGELGRGVLEVASDLRPEDPELQWMETLSRETGRPVTFACLQNDFDSGQWKRLLDASDAIAERGGWLAPQIAARPTSMLMGLQSSVHPFVLHQGYHAVAHLPLAERVARLRDPEVRAAILAEQVEVPHPLLAYITQSFHKLFPLGDPPDYEPGPERSVAAIAAREGRTPQAVAYELLLERDGLGFLYFPFLNYSDGDFAAIHEMLAHPRAVVGLADGGAHCGVICDASVPTYLLTHWVRDRTRGPRVPIEKVVARQTRETARLYGMEDRGVLAPGMLADVNVIDMDRLAIEVPEMIFDLPAQGRRLVQRARGYRATVKRGVVTYEDGTPTGALPGQLVRGPQAAPSA
jgi:N-acyl-D-aspartate/D-glutamate deacylase